MANDLGINMLRAGAHLMQSLQRHRLQSKLAQSLRATKSR